MNKLKLIILTLFVLLPLCLLFREKAAQAQSAGLRIGERPTLEEHVRQTAIEAGRIRFVDLLDLGETIFAARWNSLDGQGRPAATGAGTPTKRDPLHNVPFVRTSGPDSTSCADCHHQPGIGGAGGFVANVFVLAQNLDPVTDSVSAEFSNERNTLGMNGSGAIEMLAREMTAELLVIRETAKATAVRSGKNTTLPLLTKGVSFGQITARPDLTVDTSQIEGIDADLIVKPFHQKGVVNSVRVFTVNAYNHHHGMQAVERFGIGQKDNKGNAITTSDLTKMECLMK